MSYVVDLFEMQQDLVLDSYLDTTQYFSIDPGYMIKRDMFLMKSQVQLDDSIHGLFEYVEDYHATENA